ncbi:MAG: DoxX family protein [Pseudomonadota bacterium]|uniref:DoxX family protein n=1 Tax=unclassified Phenylobacterium TaxID=2640670 RepID=UPI0009E81060|nr:MULTISPECIES: DoxX family protein [unclassified Phenylobacterium]MBT9471640.1 DoxX family protein [Phenylobacterium sp.]
MVTLTDTAPAATPRLMLWTGRVLTGLAIAFMTFDTVIKLIDLQVVRDSLTQLGYPTALGPTIGAIELICLLLYIFPRTAVLGAVLLTAVMGGAIASHMRLGDPLVSHTLFGVYLGAVIWGGLYLRDAKLRAIFPIRR